MLGLGSRTGIDIEGEAAGVLPSQEWKRQRFKRPEQQKWYAGETISVGIGQGYNAYTPLQLARRDRDARQRRRDVPAAHRELRRGHPHARAHRRSSPARCARSTSSPSIIAVVKQALVGVNKEGTGARAFAGAGYASAGKTGTAQVIGMKQGEKYVESRVQERHRDHALFIAYAPADKPKIALAVIVENAGFGARAAAPIARKVLDYYLLGKSRPRRSRRKGDGR